MKTAVKFLISIVIAHVVSYFIAGVLAYQFLDLKEFYPPNPNAFTYLRDPLSKHVLTFLWPAQILRGILYALALLPLRKQIVELGQFFGGLTIAGIILLVGYIAASSGFVEKFVWYNEFSVKFTVGSLIEIAIQTVIMGQLVLWLEKYFNKNTNSNKESVMPG